MSENVGEGGGVLILRIVDTTSKGAFLRLPLHISGSHTMCKGLGKNFPFHFDVLTNLILLIEFGRFDSTSQLWLVLYQKTKK